MLLRDPEDATSSNYYLAFAYHLIRAPRADAISPSQVEGTLVVQRNDVGQPAATKLKGSMGSKLAYNLFSDLAILQFTLPKDSVAAASAATLLAERDSQPHVGVALGRPAPFYGETTSSIAYTTPFEATTAVINYLDRQRLPNLFREEAGQPSIPPGQIIQLSLAAIRPGYSGGPVFTEVAGTGAPEFRVAAIVFAATQERSHGLASGASDLVKGIKTLKDGKPLDASGWSITPLTSSDVLPADYIVDPLPGAIRAGLIVIGNPRRHRRAL